VFAGPMIDVASHTAKHSISYARIKDTSTEVKQLLLEASKLSTEDRAGLATELLASHPGKLLAVARRARAYRFPAASSAAFSSARAAPIMLSMTAAFPSWQANSKIGSCVRRSGSIAVHGLVQVVGSSTVIS
jgi:hypothetical protein